MELWPFGPVLPWPIFVASGLHPMSYWSPVLLGKELGWLTVEINPAESRVSHLVELRLPLPAAVALEAIWERVRG